MRFSTTVSTIFSLSIFCLLSSKGWSALSKTQKKKGGYYEQQLSYAVEITHANITSNYADWDSDMAIVFYAPWCKYCKQLSPSWEQIAAATSTKKDLVVGKFNCETPAENVQFCQKVGVDRYPSIYFMGYGNLQQAPPGKPFAANPQPRIARYVADLYPEAIYDWVRMCAQISTMQRSWDDFKSIYTGKSRGAKKLQTLKSKVLSSIPYGLIISA
jgi:thiol-disulfide isomerase/thioredoxin